MMYKLYYYPLNASLAPHFVLEELGVDYQLCLVDRKNNGQKSPEYLKLNPAGRIPTLIDKEQAVFESPAICVHLAESYPESGLIPKLGETNRAVFHQWMMYLTNTLQAELMIYFYPEKHCSTASQSEDIKNHQQSRILESLELLNQELSSRDYIVGGQFSACDLFLLMLLIWADEIDKPPLAFDNLKRYLRRLATRDSVRTVAEKEKIDLNCYIFE